LVTVSVGTDYGGSVRFPAACCGVVGLRPTPGRIDSTGQLPKPPDDSPRARFSLVGLLGRRVQDVADVFTVLDTRGARRVAAPARSVAVTGDQPALAEVAERLRLSGVEIAEADPRWLRDAEDTFTELRALDTFDDLRAIADQLGDQLRELVQAAPTHLDQPARARLEERAAQQRRKALAFFAHNDLLVTRVADLEIPPPAGQAPDLRALGPCRAITLLGLPAVATSGVHIVGPPGHDEDVLALAKLIEHQGRASDARR
jgi:Asp-tRNA(Asn)/Glu-tRNA(Gln) amidotransferase A subunit family amidase